MRKCKYKNYYHLEALLSDDKMPEIGLPLFLFFLLRLNRVITK